MNAPFHGITSTSNPRIKAIAELRKRRERDEQGRFIIEGSREVERAVAAGIVIEQVVRCPGIGDGDAQRRVARAADLVGSRVLDVAPHVFDKISGRENPDGLLVVAESFDTDLDRLDPGENPLVLVVAEIEKPGNLGTMIRSAVAAGATTVLVTDPVTDVFNPQVVRASQGALFGVPIGVAETRSAVAWLGRRRIEIYPTGPRARCAHWDVPLDQPSAVVIGAEHRGLPEEWFAAGTPITIPMPGTNGVDSLNASAAAAVVLFEAVRQRSA